MIDVLVAHSYFLQYDPKQLRKMRPYPPLGTLYAAAVLRDAGYRVALFDAMFAESEAEFEKALREYQPRYVVLYEDSFHFLVKMCLSRMRQAALAMVRMARSAGATVMVAGPDVTDRPEEYLSAGARFALLGEADHTVRCLTECLESGTDPATVNGIAYLGGAEVKRTLPRQAERFPDRFPFPAWDLAELEPYRQRWMEAHGHFSLNMVSTRGCPYHCNWCAKPIWGQHYAMRSPGCVAEEMAQLKRLYRPDHIWFADDIFGLRPGWTEQFAVEVEELDAHTPFTIQTRVDRITPSSVAALAHAGCREVWLGAESGSQRILDGMEKGTRVKEVSPARALLKRAGIRVGFFLQFGYPGETLEDIRETITMVQECMPDEIGVSVSYPLPGTKFYDRVRAQLNGKRYWTDSDDLAMMFKGTYKTEFYRTLHRTLHRDLDLRHKLAETAGLKGSDLLDEAQSVHRDWFELGRLEATERNSDPTILALLDEQRPAPDLSKSFSV